MHKFAMTSSDTTPRRTCASGLISEYRHANIIML